MNPHAKAKKLVRLAADSGTPEKEAMAAAYAACKLIDEHNLLDDPLTGLAKDLPEDVRESVEAATDLFKSLTDPKFVGSAKKLARSFLGGRRRVRRYDP